MSEDDSGTDEPGQRTGLRGQTGRFLTFLRAERAGRVALALTAVWAAGLGAYAWGYFSAFETGISGPLAALLMALALVLPVILFWLTAVLFVRLSRMHADAAKVRDSVRILEEKLSLHGPTSLAEIERAAGLASRAAAENERNHWQGAFQTIDDNFHRLENVLADILAARSAEDDTLRDLIREAVAETRPPALAQAGDYVAAPDDGSAETDQADLPLGTPEVRTADRLTWADIARTLNFPDSDDDYAGLAARKRAIRNRATLEVLRSAQDLLNLLAQSGIYTDDLRASLAPAAQWRRFAAGIRGRDVAAVGGIRDKSALAITRARMRSDQVFRDAALHFQRKFDALLQDFARSASDRDILALADSRSGRAFMLCARVNGTFD